VREVLTRKGRLHVAANALGPLSLTPFARLLLRAPGRPRTQAEVQQLHDAVANRFEGAWEHALEYINKRNDRLLNQGRGLLTFDGLVLTALRAVYQQSHLISAWLVLGGCVCAVLAASVLLITQLSVHFGQLSKYANAQNEFPSALIRCAYVGKASWWPGSFPFLPCFASSSVSLSWHRRPSSNCIRARQQLLTRLSSIHPSTRGPLPPALHRQTLWYTRNRAFLSVRGGHLFQPLS
jgi:hypothetical protein